MKRTVKYDNSILFEVEKIDGVDYLVKKDKEVSKKTGKNIYIKMSFDEILNSGKDVIYLK